MRTVIGTHDTCSSLLASKEIRTVKLHILLEIRLPCGAVAVDILPGARVNEAEFIGRDTHDFTIALMLSMSPFNNVTCDAGI